MLSKSTQTAIAVLHDLSSGDVNLTVEFFLSEEEWKELFDKLEEGKLIRLLPDKKPGILFSYELTRPLAHISLLDVLQAINEPIRCTKPTPEEFYACHRQMALKVGVFNQVARTFLSEIKIVDW